MKILACILFALFLQGCTSPSKVIENRMEVGKQEGLAEEARRNGDEAMARIHEDIARSKKSGDKSFSLFDVFIEAIFD
jgi:hypothetical protein